MPERGFKPYGKQEGTPDLETTDGLEPNTADTTKNEKEDKDNV